MMNPPIPALSPVCTRIRVERLSACAAGVAVGVGVGEGGVAVGLGVAAGVGEISLNTTKIFPLVPVMEGLTVSVAVIV